MRMFGIIAIVIGLGIFYVAAHQHKHPLDVTARDIANAAPSIQLVDGGVNVRK